MHLNRHARLALFFCTLLPLQHAQATDDLKAPADRARSLLNSFDVMCNLAMPNFDHLAAKATAMRMMMLDEQSETTPTGETVQEKAWVSMLTTGPFALRIEKMSGLKGIVTTCAIEGPVPDVDAFREIVIKTHRLSTTQKAQMIEGARTYYWDNYSGDGSTLVVRDFERPSGHFVQVKLVNMGKTEAR
jgi:hypothetical protein